MTSLLSQSAKQYRTALPEGSVSSDLLSSSGHMVPPNSMAKIRYRTLNQKVERFSSQ